ncbi:uncharacterized protein LOC106132970 [Amyelois transitella]|uniref:uncharacterized protein LOC106132970 n=1 Tax=Amyelois transitella TaxID=680683 RepID=UPI002990363B|nr:uncharacterized protein LOC106132970 [Amyelois transitella]
MKMRSTVLIMFILSVTICFVAGQNIEETRGKKKKIALFVYFADLIVKKIFILKLIYAFVFWVVIHKAGYFLAWFTSYLKEQKVHDHHPTYHYDQHDHRQPAYIAYGKSYRVM